MEHIKFSFDLLRTGLIGKWTWTKELPTEEGTYIIAVGQGQECDTLELINYHVPGRDRASGKHMELAYHDYDGEIVYLKDGCDFSWLAHA